MAKSVNTLDKYVDWQINALNSVLIGNEPYYYRKMCRYVSQNFNMPLIDVEKLPVDYVLLHYFESTFEALEEKELVSMAKELCSPDIKKEEDEQIQIVMAQLEEEQSRILKQEEGKKESLTVVKQKEFNLNFEDES